jgi:hypothetical protein
MSIPSCRRSNKCPARTPDMIYPLHFHNAMEKLSILRASTSIQEISIDLMTDLERFPQSCDSFADRVFDNTHSVTIN